ncbi:hypothetical protein CCMSSC00406_0010427 [Pleurotus cornucopiae]|uniref:Uncharacterized protein n=1 Tax=Pleurotus cornucopiae TaxID=5321 RepID=A0ACB7IJ02_PLECO|nr:hypothetical protein CCMSSC00406_0010427 [Pleurotus cornucopiae]
MLAAYFTATQAPPGLKNLIVSNSPASVPLMKISTEAILDLNPDVGAIARKHAEEGTFSSPEYQAATKALHARHFCRVDPIPEDLLTSILAVEKDPTVFSNMCGPSIYHISGFVKDWSLIPELHKITCPMLLISSPHDVMQPNTIIPWFQGVSKVKWVELQNSTHMPMFEEPESERFKPDGDRGTGPRSMERGATSSTLDSPFGSQLNTPIDEKFQNLGGILRIQSSDFAQVEAEDKDGLVKQQAATTAVESINEESLDDPPLESRSPSNQKPMSSATASNLFSSVVNELFSSSEPASGLEYVASCIIKVLCFLPWCALVGGTILLAPEYLEQVTFCTGYTPSPSTPIHRFAHWSEYAATHILSFVVLLGSVVWWNLPLGLLLFSGVTAQIVMTWSEFVVDPNVPLGEDDQQTLYVLAKKFAFGGAASMEVKCLGSKYYAIADEGESDEMHLHAD